MSAVILQPLWGIAGEIVRLFTDAAPYILFGLVAAGIIQAFISREQVSRHLGKPGLRSVLLAAIIGIPLPLCSCGVIPAAVSLRKSGASNGATTAFLIATPESSIDSIAVSYALLDPLMTVFRPVAAFISAVVTGISENLLGEKEIPVPAVKGTMSCIFCGRDDSHSHSIIHRLGFGITYAFTDLLCDISRWLAIGIAAGGVISFLIPAEFVSAYLGHSIWSMAIMLLVGVPMYICASASTPIAAALIAKGMSPGAALVFLLVGPATNMATLLAVSRLMGKRSAAIYVAALSICAIIAGLLLNVIYRVGALDIRAHLGQAGEMVPAPLRAAGAIILLFFMIACRRKRGSCHL